MARSMARSIVTTRDIKSEEWERPTDVARVRTRRPRWTDTPAAYPGLWAVRWKRTPERRDMIQVKEAKEYDPRLQWSDRHYQWPLEPDVIDPEDELAPTPTYDALMAEVYGEPEEKHGPIWWLSLGILIGLSCGAVLGFGLYSLVMNH
jgi:hypothetical protein